MAHRIQRMQNMVDKVNGNGNGKKKAKTSLSGGIGAKAGTEAKGTKKKKMFGSEQLYKEDKAYKDAYKAYQDSSDRWVGDVEKFIEGKPGAGNYPKPNPPKMEDYYSDY